MISIAVFGANGFVGKSLCASFSTSGNYRVIPITRDNYSRYIGKQYDIVINTATPSARFWAKNNPVNDFQETVQKTANIFYGCTFEKFVQISTVSARCQLDTIYGRHKLAAENICNHSNNLIVRLSSMFGDGLEKGVLIDILKRQKIFIDGESRYSFASIDFVSDYIVGNLEKSGVIEVGAFNALRLIDIAHYLKADVKFQGVLDIQEIQNPDKNFPDCREVLKFLDKIKSKFNN